MVLAGMYIVLLQNMMGLFQFTFLEGSPNRVNIDCHSTYSLFVLWTMKSDLDCFSLFVGLVESLLVDLQN